MLNKEVKTKWLEALRGDQYTQANGVMYKETIDGKHSMCCLGVLEHICGTPLETFLVGDNGFPDDLGRYRKSPREGLREPISNIGIDSVNSIEAYLAEMNDEGKSFEEIALFIEKYL